MSPFALLICASLALMTKSYTVDTSNPVLVTGATGYVAGVLIRELLMEGVTVHATVRDPTKKDRLQYLQDIADANAGSIHFFRGDLIDEGSFADAMKGCTIVFHTASPFQTVVKDPEKDLIEPAVRGTENVLSTVSKTPSVKRVVLTSSCAAIYSDNTDSNGKALDEDTWNRESSLEHNPYSLSKTLAEQKAWTIAGSQTQWKLVTINPSLVVGPGLKYHASSTSFTTIYAMADGSQKIGTGRLSFGLVDVRDVAQAHMAAAYVESASGRHILNHSVVSLWEMSSAIKTKFPDYPWPRRQFPTWVVWLVAPYLPLSRRFVRSNFGVPLLLDHSKSKAALGIDYHRPISQTLQEMFQQMVDAGAFQK